MAKRSARSKMYISSRKRLKMHIMEYEGFVFPTRMLGCYDLKFPSGEPTDYITSVTKMCDLCEENKVRWGFADAGLARVLGVKLMFVYLCDMCREFVMSTREARKCAGCKCREGFGGNFRFESLYSVTLADGTESKHYCVNCVSEGGARKEIQHSLQRSGRRRRCKSV